MDFRIDAIDKSSEKMLRRIELIAGVPVSTERHPDNPLVRSVPPLQVRMFDVGLFAEAEMLRAHQAGAHFAACLAGATMNEALLSLMCLMFRDEVEACSQFKSSKLEKKLKNKSFEEVISRWQFQHLINVASELEWIPTEVVSEEMKTAFADGYREVMPQANPAMTHSEIEAVALTFSGPDAGAAILTFTQEIRNLIHAGRWLRVKSGFEAIHFARWCQFAVLVFGEVRVCLMHSMMMKNEVRFENKINSAKAKFESLPACFQAEFARQMKERMSWNR